MGFFRNLSQVRKLIIIIPPNEIWYTTNTGNTVELSDYWVGGEQPISNTYEDGKGIMKFANPITSIDESEFDSCISLTSVTLPNSVINISYFAFFYCSSLTSINIPNSVTNIGDWAFSGCESLTSITIPDSVTNISEDAFSYCTRLASVIYKGTTYTSKSALTTALTSNRVTVGSYTFDNTALSD